MHIAEGFLPPAHAVAWTVAAAPFVVYGARQVVVTVRQHPSSGPLLAAVGAFSFVMSAIKLPSVTGSSSHPTGTGLGTAIFRPPVMAFLGTIVLLFQALLLAHGGLTTLGANVFSMAIAGPWAGFAVFYALRRSGVGVLPAVFALAFVADLVTYVVTSFQLALAFPASEGGFWESFGEFMGVFAITQVPLAIVEGLITVVVVRVLMQVAASELLGLGFLKRTEVPDGAGDGQEQTDREEAAR
ncbi:energy-coupling factor ABC transporter permease [Gordonia sp. PKS22-38]|uniref:Cobalt transport protein CbiM n=1 Tax=Gordonia prachuapensis TaxID=3115651 RepID=A0ABU7MRT8_9ACTN|nr:energy-coupling factor ABC transporter permease [Gordonia sp. PKS22-38]